MRGKLACVIMCVGLGWLTVSCVTKATDDEIETMCDNLVHLRGDVSRPSTEKIVSDIAMKFDEAAKQLKDDQLKAEEALEEEMQAELSEAKNDAEKTEIHKSYAAKLKKIEADQGPELAAVDTKKKEAVEAAKKKAEENRAAWESAVEACVTEAKKESVSQKVARCRIDAKTADKYWNGCR